MAARTWRGFLVQRYGLAVTPILERRTHSL
jgi:hypothetical protein